jgi:hypothetical protein
MADIVYEIDYDEKEGLVTSQHISNIGSPDRIRFVTSEKTAKEYQVALKRDPNSRSPFQDLKDPYPVPSKSAKAKWIDVVHPGKRFHYICGILQDGEFVALRSKQTAAINQPNSLPFPT